MLLLQQLHRRFGVISQVHVITLLQRLAQPFARRFLVVNYQQGRSHRAHLDTAAGARPFQAAATLEFSSISDISKALATSISLQPGKAALRATVAVSRC